MIEFLTDGDNGIVGIRATGTLTDADYKQELIPKLESLFEKHDRLKLLILLDEGFRGWELQAAWDDAALGLKHRSDFEKLAIVGGPAWVEWGTKLIAFMMAGDVKTFPLDRLDDAWAWIRA